jgi:hypothetical protein
MNSIEQCVWIPCFLWSCLFVAFWYNWDASILFMVIPSQQSPDAGTKAFRRNDASWDPAVFQIQDLQSLDSWVHPFESESDQSSFFRESPQISREFLTVGFTVNFVTVTMDNLRSLEILNQNSEAAGSVLRWLLPLIPNQCGIFIPPLFSKLEANFSL